MSTCFVTSLHISSVTKGVGSLSTCNHPCMRTNQLSERSRTTIPKEWDLRLCSPSKINLFLRIMGRRPDGAFIWFTLVAWFTSVLVPSFRAANLLHSNCE